MNRKILFAILTAILAALLAVSAFAAEPVYVGGDAAVATLDEAFAALDGKGGSIVLCDAIECADITIPEQTGDLTITAEAGGSLTLSGTLTLAKNTNGNTVKFDMPLTVGAKGATIYGGFNTVHFTKNFSVTGKVDFYGGVVATVSAYETSVWPEETTAMNLTCMTELPYSITVDNGNFGIFMGGNHRTEYGSLIGSIAEIEITINGGTFTSPVSYKTGDALKIEPAFSVSGMSFITDKTTLNITGGEFDTPIYVQGYIGRTGTRPSIGSYITKSDVKYYAADGDVAVNISGGAFGTDCIEISAEQTAASYNRVLRGNFDVTVGADATFAADTLFDATQVKAYENGNAKATLTAANPVNYKRFDVVNGNDETYKEPIRIACVGDSITQGTGATSTETGAYPAQLYKLAVEKGQDVIVSNYGCASYMVMDYEGKWYNSTLAYVLSHEETDADYIVLGLGTNDSDRANDSVGQAKHFRQMYEELVASYEDLSTTKKVFGTSAIYRAGSQGWDIGSTCVIRPMQKEVLTTPTAAGKRVYVDLYALLLDEALGGRLLGSDVLHPHTAGYAIYAEAIYDAVLAEEPVTEVAGFELDEIYVSASGKDTAVGDTADDPINNIIVAFAKAADGATIYIMGEYKHTRIVFSTNEKFPFSTPYGVNSLTIKGYDDDAILSINSKIMYANGDIRFDNLTLDNCYNAEPIHLMLGYHNAEFTETFKSNDGIQLNAGYMVYSDVPTADRYSSAEAVSSDNDCTIKVNGGYFTSFVGGNLQYPNSGAAWGGNAPYGTYSGNMTVEIGEGATFGACTHKNKEGETLLAGLVGMNYLTGTVNAKIGAWGKDVPIRDYALIGTYSSRRAEYNEAKNTGTVNITLDGIDNEMIRTGDIDKNGTVNVADLLKMIDYKLHGIDDTYDSRYYYDKKDITLVTILRALKNLVK